mgnify:FL=1
MSYLDGRRSIFPEGGVDQIQERYNLPASLKPSLKRYQELYLKESLSPNEQTELNNLTIVLRPYMPDVEHLNFVGDVLVNTQKFFKNGVEPYIEEKKLDFQAEVDKLTYRGEWQPNTQYYKKNVVTSGGEGFIAKVDSINQAPPSATYWGKIAQKGEKGDPSLNISFKGAYDSAMAYTLGDAVTYGGLWYYAKQNTKGNPPTNADYWELQSNQTLVSDVEPFDNRVTLWINTNL